MSRLASVEGDLAAMPEHAPTLVVLRGGIVTVYEGDREAERFYVSGGFAEITGTRCAVMADEALDPGDIDRADAERRLAQERQPVAARIAGHLLELPAVHTAGPPTVLLAAPKKDVASLLGTTPEAFSRGLRRLVDDGVVAVDGPRVRLLDPGVLEDLASG